MFFIYSEPDRQFLLVKEHISKIRKNLYFTISKIKIYVERNLGFEAEHHHRALGDIAGVEFYVVSLLFRKYKIPNAPTQNESKIIKNVLTAFRVSSLYILEKISFCSTIIWVSMVLQFDSMSCIFQAKINLNTY